MATKRTTRTVKRASRAPTGSTATRGRICDACGAENASTATACSQCGGDRFAPSWVRQLRRINRSFAVQVTDPHPLAESEDPRLTLYKWWPGNKSTFNINSAAQWEAVKSIVDTDLAPYLGWKTTQAVKKEIAAQQQRAAALDREARELAERDPRLVAEILRGLKLDRIAEDDLPKLGETIGEVAQILLGVDESHRHAIQQLVKKLPAQGELAIRQLAQLMEELTIGQITAVASEVRRRVGLLNLFKERASSTSGRTRSPATVRFTASLRRRCGSLTSVTGSCTATSSYARWLRSSSRRRTRSTRRGAPTSFAGPSTRS